jgi:hypothetical protein
LRFFSKPGSWICDWGFASVGGQVARDACTSESLVRWVDLDADAVSCNGRV